MLAVLTACAQTDMKRVVGDNATLPCHHQFWVGDDPTLDIEWLLLKPTNRVVSDCVKVCSGFVSLVANGFPSPTRSSRTSLAAFSTPMKPSAAV